jgi:3D (Asp-Asp-Asp) domain-containing protein
MARRLASALVGLAGARLPAAVSDWASRARDVDARMRLRLPRGSLAVGIVATAPACLGICVALGAEGCGPRTLRGARAAGADRSEVVALQPTALPASTSSDPGRSASPRAPVGAAIEVRWTAYGLAAEGPCGGGRALVPLLRCDGSELARVSSSFGSAVRMQGSGRLCDGRVVSIRKLSPACFAEVPPSMRFGVTASGRAAIPFRSIAVDPSVFPLGHWYYVAALDGRSVPASGEGADLAPFVHDGCVRADDVGGGVRGAHVDWFVGPLGDGVLDWVRRSLGGRLTLAPADVRCAPR